MPFIQIKLAGDRDPPGTSVTGHWAVWLWRQLVKMGEARARTRLAHGRWRY